MKRSDKTRLALTLLALTLMTGVSYAQSGKTDLGKQEYEANCAVCHAPSGRGGGPYVDFLVRSPPDLTQLSKGNGGVFPVSRMYEVIEGNNVPSHGTRDMPIWGTQYRIKAAQYHGDVDYDPEAFVRARILALIEYLSRLQER